MKHGERVTTRIVSVFCYLIAVTLVTGINLSWGDSSKNEYSDRLQAVSSSAFVQGAPRYARAAAEFIRTRLPQAENPREKALLKGLLWIAFFVEDERNFSFVFSDVLVMLAELKRERTLPAVGKAAGMILESKLKRGSYVLPALFSPDEPGRWEYISILPYILDSNARKKEYYRFYRRQYSSLPFPDHLPEYMSVLKRGDFDSAGDYLIDYAFLELLKVRYPDFPVGDVPRSLSDFTQPLKTMAFPFEHGHEKYHDQNYFVTHIVFAKTLYGARPAGKGPFELRLLRYLREQFPIVRSKVGDLDLLGEYLNCFKLYGIRETPEIREATSYLLSEQHESGAWGTEEDFRGDPYDQFHPTWAVMTGIAEIAH